VLLGGLLVGALAITSFAGAAGSSAGQNQVQALGATEVVPLTFGPTTTTTTTTTPPPAPEAPAAEVAAAAAAPAVAVAPTPTPAPAVAAPEPAPEPTPVSDPAPAPAPSGSVEDAIATYFGDVFTQAYNVARCESSLNPGAVSRGGGNWGLFQINTVHKQRVADLGYSWDQILDPYVNALVARSIYDGAGGWGPWGCRRAAYA
jgi:soluble lytic murein transglycosylase-like protein